MTRASPATRACSDTLFGAENVRSMPIRSLASLRVEPRLTRTSGATWPASSALNLSESISPARPSRSAPAPCHAFAAPSLA